MLGNEVYAKKWKPTTGEGFNLEFLNQNYSTFQVSSTVCNLKKNVLSISIFYHSQVNLVVFVQMIRVFVSLKTFRDKNEKDQAK